jgi:predicted small lipoprotein YifL
VKHVIRSVLPALLLALVAGCGSDEPALKEMSDADRAAQAKKQKEYQDSQRAGGGVGMQQAESKDYRNAATSGEGPRRGQGR